jgi:uncharacterized membrane protein YoaK (UPF0700 family)
MSTESVTTPLITPADSHATVRWLLDALTASSGAADAISFLALGKVFTAFMTGNIAFLGMALAGSPIAPRFTWVLASMAGFACGVYIATMIVRLSTNSAATGGEAKPGPVWPKGTTRALAVALLAHLCFVVIWISAGGHPNPSTIPVLLALWALAFGMQSAAVRQLNIGGIFTTAATATFIFAFGDYANHRPLTGDEHRRLRGVLISLFIGATAGGVLLIHAPILAPVLPLVITVAVVVTAAKAFGDQPGQS